MITVTLLCKPSLTFLTALLFTDFHFSTYIHACIYALNGLVDYGQSMWLNVHIIIHEQPIRDVVNTKLYVNSFGLTFTMFSPSTIPRLPNLHMRKEWEPGNYTTSMLV